MSKAVHDALSTIQYAHAELDSVVKAEYPVGSAVAWDRCTRRCVGQVLDHGYDGRMKVVNRMTGREYWINPTEII
jgi:hypothetical protein